MRKQKRWRVVWDLRNEKGVVLKVTKRKYI